MTGNNNLLDQAFMRPKIPSFSIQKVMCLTKSVGEK